MATPGVDCHLTLQHASVNSGTAVGFILKADRRGPTYEITRQRQGLPNWADQGAWHSLVQCVLLGLPRLLTPTGAEYTLTPSQVRTFLVAFWATTTPMTLADPLQTLTVMWRPEDRADGLAEQVYSDGAEFRLRLVTP